jgi:hypothetical protein
MKERQRISEIGIKEAAEIGSIIRNEDGTFSIRDVQGNLVNHEQYEATAYFGSSGKPKVLRSIARKSDDRVGDNLWIKYDKIGFIDASYLPVDFEKLFVCSPSIAVWEDETKMGAYIHPQSLLVGYCSAKVNPERIGWCDFIQRIQVANFLSSNDRMLIVVDSEKSLIPSINSRVEPVFPGFFLPDSFTMAFATADGGAENSINKEMIRRDKVAKRALAIVKKDRIFLDKLIKSRRLYINNIFEQGA